MDLGMNILPLETTKTLQFPAINNKNIKDKCKAIEGHDIIYANKCLRNIQLFYGNIFVEYKLTAQWQCEHFL
jgi:hypothetical protein